MRQIGFLLPFVILAGACGGDEDSATPPNLIAQDPFKDLANETDFGVIVTGPIEEAAAQSTIAAALVVRDFADPNVPWSPGYLMVAYTSPIEMLGSALGTTVAATNDRTMNGLPSAPQKIANELDLTEGCYEATVTRLTMDECEVTANGVTGIFNGFLAFENERAVAEIAIVLQYANDGQSIDSLSTISSDIGVDVDKIEGYMRFNMEGILEVDDDQAGFAIDSKVIYDVDIDGNCLIGGDIKVGAQIVGEQAGMSQTLRAIGRAAFGPACDETVVYARSDAGE